MADAVRLLVGGLPAEIVREIGLRLRGVTITEFENAQQLGRAASQGDAALVILSDVIPAQDSIYIVRRARDANDKVRIAYCMSMAQAEAALHALREINVDRFFLAPVDIDEMLRELAKMCGVDVLAPQASHGEHIAAAVLDAWERARGGAFKMIDTLDDAAIALLENNLSAEVKSAAEQQAQALIQLTTRFGFPRGTGVARELAEKFGSVSLSPVDGVSVSEQLLVLRSAMEGLPQPPPETALSRDDQGLASPDARSDADESAIKGAKILIVDDEPQITRGLTTLLGRRGMVVTSVNDPLLFWTAIDEVKPSLVLLDLAMPRISGTELCRAIRADRRWSELPVVFVTGYTDEDSVRRVFAAGADDYVGKPFVPAELMMRIESRLAGVKARKAPVETDPLTGLPTARRVSDDIERFLRLARRKTDPYSLAVLEVDAFVTLAEIYGRSIGDRVLRAVGELLPKSFRGEDVVGWWGGAEFMIGMYGSSKEHAAIKLTQICVKLGEMRVPADDGRTVPVACTGGVAQFQVDGDTVNALREAGLEAIRQVREAGLNRVGISGVKATGALTRRVDVAIVEADSALVSLLQHAMESRNLRVATFVDGDSAAAALTGPIPEIQASVILLDVDLPGLNGLDVLRRLKAVEVTRVSSVVMLTARTGERDVLTALELGAIDHIAKPFSVPVLMHKVRTLLKQSQ